MQVHFSLSDLAENRAAAEGVAFAIGVCDVSPGDMPMWPYIGVGHSEMDSVPSQTVEPGGIVPASMVRMDLMDERFMNSQSIPTWPNWELRLMRITSFTRLHADIFRIEAMLTLKSRVFGNFVPYMSGYRTMERRQIVKGFMEGRRRVERVAGSRTHAREDAGTYRGNMRVAPTMIES